MEDSQVQPDRSTARSATTFPAAPLPRLAGGALLVGAGLLWAAGVHAVAEGRIDEAKLVAAHERVDAMADRFNLDASRGQNACVDEAEVRAQLSREIGAEAEAGRQVDPTDYAVHRSDELRCELSEGPSTPSQRSRHD